jgi:signal transduction histidine kinase
VNSKKILHAIYSYVIFFLVVAFVVSSCTMLFVTIMANSMEITLTNDNIKDAAKATMLNALLLALIFTVFDFFRRKITVERPVKKIIEAGRKLTSGDFSVRISRMKTLNNEDGFSEIADCFNKMAEELSNTETLRTDFVANVSHELKTPLAVMQNYGALLAAPDLDDEERIEYAEGIKNASSRLATLISNILKLNKLENQQISPIFKEYNLSEQLCECLLEFERAWEKKELDIIVDIEEDVLISSDAEMLSLVWNNLFSNAIKFTDKGGKISVSLKKEFNCAIVKVSDTGCGISGDVGKHIFDKFYQGDTSHATEGNGLGLALVKRVIDITGCDISVESELGEGTTFTVKIGRSDNGLEENR